MRGSILDVYSFSGELPYRVDFFDDEIDSIRAFNVEHSFLKANGKASPSYLPEWLIYDTAGVSLLHFADAATIVICQSVSWLETRIKAISSETLSEAVCVTGEGRRMR